MRCDIRHHFKAPARDGADNTLILAIVLHRRPSRVDAGADRRVGHDTPVPDHLDQFVLADKLACPIGQKMQKIKNLRFK